MRAFLLLLLLALVAPLGTGCSTAKPNPDGIPGATQPSEQVELDPVLIRATTKDGAVEGSELINSGDVFKKAQRAFKKKQYKEAVAHYKVLIDSFPDSDYHLPSLYNSGLSLERLERWEEALTHYSTIVEDYGGKSIATDALYRSSECFKRLERHQEVLTTIARILDRTGLASYDRTEAYTRQGDAHLALDDLSKAEDSFRRAITSHKRAPDDEVVPGDSHFVVAAQYGLSQVYHRLFLGVKFRLPADRMEKDLEDKAQLFMQAQGKYIRTMRMGNAYWATAAGYAIGQMYEQFYTDLLTAETPKLQDEESKVYFEALREKIRPFMERALQIYEKNIILSERYNVDNDFTRQTQVSLERLKRYIGDDKLQKQDESNIREGKHIQEVGSAPDPEERTDPAAKDPKDKEGEDKEDEDKAPNSSKLSGSPGRAG